ncbi:MAG: TetR/AcrR family transcriptional regulator, partial [Acidimicrobiales bacterium]
EAAARIMAEEGPDALSIRRLSAEVNASTMAVYTWYGSKPNLMRAVFREAFVRFGHRLMADPTSSDPLVDLLMLGNKYRANALADPNMYAVMFGRSGSAVSPEPEDLVLAAGTFEILVDSVGRCVDAGILRCDPRAGAWQIWACVHGAMSLELAQMSTEDHVAGEEAYRSVGRTVLVGLGADPARLDVAVRDVAAAYEAAVARDAPAESY